MNVLHIDEQTGWRGGEQQASYLIRGLVKRGHHVLLAGRKGGAFLSADHEAGTLVKIAAPFWGEWDLWSARILARAVRKHDIHILHAHTSHAHTCACLARALAGRGKVIVSRRVDFAPQNTLLNRWKYRCPAHIIAISRRIAEVLRDFGVEESRLSVVYSGIDPARFNVEPLARSAIGIREGVPLLGNVAALVGHKDHETLLAAMPLVLRELPDLQLVIAGEGNLRRAIERRIGQLGIGSSVKMLGYRKDIPRLLRTLDAFVISSKQEGLGTTILDAMACELPVVATAGGGIPEIVTHEQTGLLAPTQNPGALAGAIVRVFREPALVSNIVSNARRLVLERFSVEAMVEGNLQVYDRLL